MQHNIPRTHMQFEQSVRLRTKDNGATDGAISLLDPAQVEIAGDVAGIGVGIEGHVDACG